MYIHIFWHRSYSSLSVETSYVHTYFLASFIFITQYGNLVCTYIFSGILHINHSVWKPRMYIHIFWHRSYSSLSVETSYVHTYFLASFLFITQYGQLISINMFSGIVHINHSVWTTHIYIHIFWHRSYSSLSMDNSYLHTYFLASFIFITQCGQLMSTYMFSGIVHINHSVWTTHIYIHIF